MEEELKFKAPEEIDITITSKDLVKDVLFINTFNCPLAVASRRILNLPENFNLEACINCIIIWNMNNAYPTGHWVYTLAKSFTKADFEELKKDSNFKFNTKAKLR